SGSKTWCPMYLLPNLAMTLGNKYVLGTSAKRSALPISFLSLRYLTYRGDWPVLLQRVLHATVTLRLGEVGSSKGERAKRKGINTCVNSSRPASHCPSSLF